MFDVAFSELLIIAVVALIVIGPQRLPKVARTAGVLLGRLQRYVSNVKADINREIQLDELRKLQAELAESARKLESQVGAGVSGVQRSLDDTAQSLNASVASVNSELTTPPAPPTESAAATPAVTAAANDIPVTPWTAESFAAAFGGAEAGPAKAPAVPAPISAPAPAAQVANESKV